MLYTAQVLKVCRTPGPTACLKMLSKVCFGEKLEKEKKNSVTGLEPAAIRFTLEFMSQIVCYGLEMLAPKSDLLME